MTNKAQQTEINELKHTEFVSKLTVIKGRKDIPETGGTVAIEKRIRTEITWNMPVERTGYIKCRDFDFL